MYNRFDTTISLGEFNQASWPTFLQNQCEAREVVLALTLNEINLSHTSVQIPSLLELNCNTLSPLSPPGVLSLFLITFLIIERVPPPNISLHTTSFNLMLLFSI